MHSRLLANNNNNNNNNNNELSPTCSNWESGQGKSLCTQTLSTLQCLDSRALGTRVRTHQTAMDRRHWT